MTTTPHPAEAERDRLAHREAALGMALDRCLNLVAKAGAVPWDRREAFAGLVARARPGLTLDLPRAYPDELSEWLLETLRRLAEVPGDLDEPGRLDYIASIRQQNERLANEVRRLKALTEGDPEVFRQIADGLAVRHWAARLLAFGFADEFKKAGAENFLVVDMHPPDMPTLSVTLQKKGGVSPSERIAQLESENADLRRQLKERTVPLPFED